MWIQSGDIEPIVVLVFDSSGEPLTGLTDVNLQVFRRSDGYYYDWFDDTFKTSVAVVTLTVALQEISAVYSPGQYKLNTTGHVDGFNTSTIVNPNANDVYFFTAEQQTGTNAANLPQVGQLRTGGALDDIVVDEFPVVY